MRHCSHISAGAQKKDIALSGLVLSLSGMFNQAAHAAVVRHSESLPPQPQKIFETTIWRRYTLNIVSVQAFKAVNDNQVCVQTQVTARQYGARNAHKKQTFICAPVIMGGVSEQEEGFHEEHKAERASVDVFKVGGQWWRTDIVKLDVTPSSGVGFPDFEVDARTRLGSFPVLTAAAPSIPEPAKPRTMIDTLCTAIKSWSSTIKRDLEALCPNP
jgi:hypothetical protein